MTKLSIITIVFLLFITQAFAQRSSTVVGRVVNGADAVQGITIQLISDKNNLVAISNANGDFTFPEIISENFRLTFSGIGYQTSIRTYRIDNKDTLRPAPVKIQKQHNTFMALKAMVNTNPINITDDTIDYLATVYKVRKNLPVKYLLKKMPGITVNNDDNIIAQGKPVTKVLVNGKDYLNGNIQVTIQNILAAIVTYVQVIDDYSDAAMRTSIKTGYPDKVINIITQNSNGTFEQKRGKSQNYK